MGGATVNHHPSAALTHQSAFNHFQLSHPFHKHVSVKKRWFSLLCFGRYRFLDRIIVSQGPRTLLIWEIRKETAKPPAFFGEVQNCLEMQLSPLVLLLPCRSAHCSWLTGKSTQTNVQGTFRGRNFGEDDERKDVQSKFLQGKALPGSATRPVCPQSVPVSDQREEGCLVNARETFF